MFLGPRCEDWKAGPCWIDETGTEDLNRYRWKRTSDTGWVHYFPDTWTEKERDDTFVKYVCQCVYDQPVSFSTKILCLQDNCIRFDDAILHIFEIGTDEDVIINQYEKSLKKLVQRFLKHVASSALRDTQ